MTTPTTTTAQQSPMQQPATWDLVASGFAEIATLHSRRYASRALDLVPPDAGQRVIDIATGAGALALLVAPRVGRVDAVDFSPAMIAELRAHAERDGVKNVEAAVMDAGALQFPDATFDAAYCMFAYMFFPDRAAAFAEMRRVLEPGARAVICTWRPIDRRMFMKVGFDAMAEAMPQVPLPLKGDLQEPEECVREMTDAGFRDVSATLFDQSYRIDSAEQYWDLMSRTGAGLVLLRKRFDDAAWAEVERKMIAALRTRIPGPTDLSAEAILTVGTR